MTCRKCDGSGYLWQGTAAFFCWLCGGSGVENLEENVRRRLRAEAAVDRAWEAG